MKLRFLTALGLIITLYGTAVAQQNSNSPDAPPAQDIAAPLDLTPFEIKEYCFDVHSDPPLARLGRFMRFANFDHYWNAQVFVVTIIKDNTQFTAQFVQRAEGTVARFFEKRNDAVTVFTKEEQVKRLRELLPSGYFNVEGQLEIKNFSKCNPNQPV